MRWFFETCPLDMDKHFAAHPPELQERTDWYAMPVNPACGIKVREGRLETKLRCAQYGLRDLGGIAGQLESWKKWSLDFSSAEEPPSVEELAGTGWLDVDKKRYLQRFDITAGQVVATSTRPVNGCEFELTELMVRNQRYFTVGFEAVGEFLELEQNLQLVAQHVGVRGGLLMAFTQETSCSYAEWLSRFALQ
jgi:hypothetical protein